MIRAVITMEKISQAISQNFARIHLCFEAQNKIWKIKRRKNFRLKRLQLNPIKIIWKQQP